MEVVRFSVTSLTWKELHLSSSFQQEVSVSVRAALRSSPAGKCSTNLGRQVDAWHCRPTRCLQNSGLVAEEKSLSSIRAADDEEDMLKILAEKLAVDLKGSCIYLIGMMGSGKTTVGRILAKALGYDFYDTDSLIEAAAGTTVAQLFADSEEDFRDAETNVLSQLSCMGRLVIATGGGAVVRPSNWGYLRYGVTVWLNVPLEALASRVLADGTMSRPLLGQPTPNCDSKQVFSTLSKILEERGGAYSNADAIVTLRELASDLGYDDITAVTPTMIAIQVLREISKRLVSNQKKNSHF